jgi:hypothetical protein
MPVLVVSSKQPEDGIFYTRKSITLFDDASTNPFVLHLVPESLDRLPTKGDGAAASIEGRILYHHFGFGDTIAFAIFPAVVDQPGLVCGQVPTIRPDAREPVPRGGKNLSRLTVIAPKAAPQLREKT